MPKFLIVNFDRYHPKSRELTSSQRNASGRLKWIRLDTDWDHDEDIALLPWDERALWPWLLARAGKGNPPGSFEMSYREISALTTLPKEKVTHAMRHLSKRGRIETENVTPA